MTHRMPIVVVTLAVMCAACGGGDGDTTTTAQVTTTTTLAPTTTEGTTTTVAAATTTTGTAATTTTAAGYAVGEPSLGPPPPLPDGGGASGSGCSPGAGDLPDGVWYGVLRERTEDGIGFDLACFYFGDIAYVEGERDGVEVNNDYYVRNENDTLRTIAVDPAATVYEIGWDQEFLVMPFSDWPADPTGYTPCPGDFCGVWLFVNGGEVTEILEQYVP